MRNPLTIITLWAARGERHVLLISGVCVVLAVLVLVIVVVMVWHSAPPSRLG